MSETRENLYAAITGVINYRAHEGCEIGQTDFCSCGLREAMERLDAAWKLDKAERDTLAAQVATLALGLHRADAQVATLTAEVERLTHWAGELEDVQARAAAAEARVTALEADHGEWRDKALSVVNRVYTVLRNLDNPPDVRVTIAEDLAREGLTELIDARAALTAPKEPAPTAGIQTVSRVDKGQ